MSLPRFKQIWQREGIGRFDGVAGKDTYYSLTDDGGSLVAVDPSTGGNRWQTALTGPAVRHAVVRLVGESVVVSTQDRDSPEVQVTLFDSADGRVGWSRSVACRHFDLRTAASRLYLRCRLPIPARHQATLIELDAANGAERARLSIDAGLQLMPSGDFCVTDQKHITCSRLVGTKLTRRWTRPTRATGDDPHLLGAPRFVVRSDGHTAEIFRAQDGQKIFQRAVDRGRGRGIDVDVQNERLFVLHSGAIDVVSLRDGVRVAQMPLTVTRGIELLQGSKHMLIGLETGGATPICVIDAQGYRIIDGNFWGLGLFLVGEFAISMRLSGYGDGTLRGYSLSQFAPPANQLDDYGKVIAVLEHFPHAHQAEDALAMLRRVPHGLDLLGQAIAKEHGDTRITAIVIAGVSKEVQFLPAVRQALVQVPVPATNADRQLLRETVHALAALDSPGAAEALLAFWRSFEKRIAPARLRADLQDEIQNTVWRYSVERDWELCPDIEFSVTPPDLSKAVLGTSSPGRGEALDDEGRWAVLCEARRDDDGNGRLSVGVHIHGGTGGDMLRPYLVLGSGPGTEIGAYLAADPHGRRLAVSMGTCLYVVDAQTGKASALRWGDGRVRTGPIGYYKTVDFSLDGSRLVYLRANGGQARAVMRDLAEGSEREIDAGAGFLVGAFFDGTGRYLVMDVAQAESDAELKSRVVRAEGNHTCQREVDLSDPHEMQFPLPAPQPQPILQRRVLPLHGGPVENAEHLSDFAPGSGHWATKYDLVPVTGSEQPGGSLPTGPFRWQRRN